MMAAPLLEVTVHVAKETSGSNPLKDDPPASPDPNDWFTWDLHQLFTCKSAVLVCREHEKLPTEEEPTESPLCGRLRLLCSVHPLRGKTIEPGAFEEEVAESIEDTLRFRAKDGVGSFRILSTKVKYDPTFSRTCKAYTGGITEKETIVMGVCEDCALATCYLTGDHFYPPAPLGFFYQGDPEKPVVPYVAMHQGFTMSAEVLRALSWCLNTSRNQKQLVHSLNWMWKWADVVIYDERDAAYWPKWGGHVCDTFRSYPVQEEKQFGESYGATPVEAVVAESSEVKEPVVASEKLGAPTQELAAAACSDKGQSEETRRIALTFLRRPSLPQTQTS